MKTKLQILIGAFAIVLSMAGASAQKGSPQPQPVPINPTTGLPEQIPVIDPATGLPSDGSPPFHPPIDPQTGLPLGDSNGSPTWIDPAWKDPAKILPSVGLPSLPLSEVARYMREQFNNAFDVILPGDSAGFDPTQIDIDLQLKNVKASEIFSAMNLQFELNKSPLRWELTVNGSRQVALLRNLPQLAPQPPPAPAPVRKVFYVGDLLDDFPGTNDESKLTSIANVVLSCTTGTTGVKDVWGGKISTRGLKVSEYPPAQLLIVSGTADEVGFAEQTLRALKEKAGHDNVKKLYSN
ncbi:MAG TPA: hypothetical protein VH280_06855 [Verrucomicrobiae bacterium]|nr:hypothetical protein [Verrucomicrobiae bacterium]